MEKLVCYTLDLERDFGGRVNSYSSLEDISHFSGVVRKNNLKLTTFAAAHIFDDRKDIIKKILDLDSEIELHSYSHNPYIQNEEKEIKKAKKTYIRFFGKKPLGYRAPKGIISKKGFETLYKENFEFDSSIFPAFLPGRYNNLKYPTQPFYYEKYDLIELPFSVIPNARVPIAMGYLQPLGLGISRSLISLFGLPNIIVFDFHLWNLYKPIERHNLPLKWKLILARNLDKGFDIFESLIALFSRKGYRSIYMKDLYRIMKEKHNKGEFPVYKK